jgi:hypothetical protein
MRPLPPGGDPSYSDRTPYHSSPVCGLSHLEGSRAPTLHTMELPASSSIQPCLRRCCHVSVLRCVGCSTHSASSLCAYWPEAAALGYKDDSSLLARDPMAHLHIPAQKPIIAWLCLLLPCAVGQAAGSLAYGEGPAGLAASPVPWRNALFTHCKCGGHDHRPGFT